jgi:hypothetical protein
VGGHNVAGEWRRLVFRRRYRPRFIIAGTRDWGLRLDAIEDAVNWELIVGLTFEIVR